MTYNRYTGPRPGSIGRNFIEELLSSATPKSLRELADAINAHYDSTRGLAFRLEKEGFISRVEKTKPMLYRATGKSPDELRTHEEKAQEDGSWNDQEHREWMEKYTQRREQRRKSQGVTQ